MREPELPRLLRRWVLMGGAYRVPGNTAPTTEWNIHCDPDAAKIAFAAWGGRRGHGHRGRSRSASTSPSRRRSLPDHVVALARRAGSTPDDSIALARGEDPMHATRSVASNPIVRFVADALRFYMEFHARYDGFYGAFIHDPLAVAAALDPTLVRTEAARRRRRAGRDADDRRDRDRLARRLGPRRRTSTSRSRPTRTSSCGGSSSASDGLAAARAGVAH